MNLLRRLDLAPLCLTEGAVIERLRRTPGVRLDPHVLNAGLLYDDRGTPGERGRPARSVASDPRVGRRRTRCVASGPRPARRGGYRPSTPANSRCPKGGGARASRPQRSVRPPVSDVSGSVPDPATLRATSCPKITCKRPLPRKEG
jgi:hypothetical protein